MYQKKIMLYGPTIVYCALSKIKNGHWCQMLSVKYTQLNQIEIDNFCQAINR